MKQYFSSIVCNVVTSLQNKKFICSRLRNLYLYYKCTFCMIFLQMLQFTKNARLLHFEHCPRFFFKWNVETAIFRSAIASRMYWLPLWKKSKVLHMTNMREKECMCIYQRDQHEIDIYSQHTRLMTFNYSSRWGLSTARPRGWKTKEGITRISRVNLLQSSSEKVHIFRIKICANPTPDVILIIVSADNWDTRN